MRTASKDTWKAFKDDEKCKLCKRYWEETYNQDDSHPKIQLMILRGVEL